MGKFVGRDTQKKRLNEIYASDDAEFVAIYGRRRVGKTSLIKHVMDKDGCLFFNITGSKNSSVKIDLKKFIKEIKRVFYSGRKALKLETPQNWDNALAILQEEIEALPPGKVTLFFDELPWLA